MAKGETQAYMEAYAQLKGAASQLEQLSHEQEPNLDKMLELVKKAKRSYDECARVIEEIRTQVDGIFSGAVEVKPAAEPEPPKRAEPPRKPRPTPLDSGAPPRLDDDIPFAPDRW